MDRYADMEDKLRILEDLNMMYIRQIALSLQVINVDHTQRLTALFWKLSLSHLIPSASHSS